MLSAPSPNPSRQRPTSVLQASELQNTSIGLLSHQSGSPCSRNAFHSPSVPQKQEGVESPSKDDMEVDQSSSHMNSHRRNPNHLSKTNHQYVQTQSLVDDAVFPSACRLEKRPRSPTPSDNFT